MIVCPICNKKFLTMSAFIKHLKNKSNRINLGETRESYENCLEHKKFLELLEYNINLELNNKIKKEMRKSEIDEMYKELFVKYLNIYTYFNSKQTKR